MDSKYLKYIISENNEGDYQEAKNLDDTNIVYIGKKLKVGKSKTIYLKVWIDEDAKESGLSKTYSGSFEVELYQGGCGAGEIATEVVKETITAYAESSKDTFTGGLVAVNTDGDLYNENDSSESIREYRYSGSNVNNYVTFNDETWRIVGVFKDENGEEHIKIVKQNLLDANNLPQEYVISNTTYKINSGLSNIAYWNYITGTESDTNDWTTAGLQYYLNTEKDENGTAGYLNKLSDISKNMIFDAKYYLGNARFLQISKIIYEDERSNSICSQEITENSEASNCYVWYGNKTTWTGKIGLLYPSDWSYSANSKYWNTISIGHYSKEAKNSTWMYETLDSAKEISTMFISPGTLYKYYIVNVRGTDGGAGAYFVNHQNAGTPRPTLYLKSNVKITSGDGSQNNQYKLSLD